MKYIKLQRFINEQNSWNAIFNGPTINISSLDQQGVDDIAAEIDCRLSPENLHCDGEISVAEANRKYHKLAGAAEDLFKFCDMNGFNRPTIWEI